MGSDLLALNLIQMDVELENAFLTGLEQNKQKLLRICSAYAKDNEDKKDLFQEVLVNIWKSMPSFEEFLIYLDVSGNLKRLSAGANHIN